MYPKLDDLITRQHVDKMAKIILLTGSIVGYAYMMELFIAWYSANLYELAAFWNRAFGWYAWTYWTHDVLQRGLTANLLDSKWMRRNYIVVFIVCQFVNAGMWYERFVIIVTSLAQDFLPLSWGHYSPSWVEIWTFAGTFGIFLSLFMLFMRFLPMVAASEVKIVIPEADPHFHPGHEPAGRPSQVTAQTDH